MIAIENTVSVILCAGLSRRFGSADKLLHPWRGMPLVQHAAGAIAALPFLAKIAVVPTGATRLHMLLIDLGFAVEQNDKPEVGQDRSLRIGIRRAITFDPDAVLVSLGDMPLVTAKHLAALLAAADPDRPAMSTEESVRSPPCVFPRQEAARLAEAESLRGRDVLKSASDLAVVKAPSGTLADFDTLADFESSS